MEKNEAIFYKNPPPLVRVAGELAETEAAWLAAQEKLEKSE